MALNLSREISQIRNRGDNWLAQALEKIQQSVVPLHPSKPAQSTTPATLASPLPPSQATTVVVTNQAGQTQPSIHITVGPTGSPIINLGDGHRGILKHSFKTPSLNITGVPTTSSAVLSNTGTATIIQVAASTIQYGPGQISYNSGSVDPGTYGKWYIYADDPTSLGGSVTYVATSSIIDQGAFDFRILFGSITTVSGTSSGGGGSGGAGGGSGGKGYLL